ncbi:MAG: hypothetical protein ACI8UO_003227 [Verrucomicrobiales bacterium]|jgi:hypothetical protein
MSLLNLTNDGTRGTLTAIYRLLLSEGSTDRDRLLGLCAPEETCDPKHARDTLRTWVELGLFEQSSKNKISISGHLPKKERGEDLLPMWACRRALAEENNERLWESENSRCADFTRAIAWLLAQDVYEAEYGSWDVVQPIIKTQTPGNDSIFGQNDTRWTGLRAWVPYLGFGYMGNKKGAPLIVDPTEALRHALPAMFGRKTTLDADEFVAAAAKSVPVLDHGVYRLAVEEKLLENQSPDAWHPLPPEQLSTSVSRALLRLTSDGTLHGEKRADASARAHLTGRGRAVFRDFSHFSFSSKLLS